jgi:hypothetical protein
MMGFNQTRDESLEHFTQWVHGNTVPPKILRMVLLCNIYSFKFNSPVWALPHLLSKPEFDTRARRRNRGTFYAHVVSFFLRWRCGIESDLIGRGVLMRSSHNTWMSNLRKLSINFARNGWQQELYQPLIWTRWFGHFRLRPFDEMGWVDLNACSYISFWVEFFCRLESAP